MSASRWTLQDQLDWELLREADEATVREVAARRPDLAKIRSEMEAEIVRYLDEKDACDAR